MSSPAIPRRAADGIFISYRRDDTQGWVGRLAEELRSAFAPAPVFFDLDSVKPGEDFVAAIETRIEASAVVLAAIGPRWLSAADAEGRRRLDDPRDLVRVEIAAALKGGRLVIPVLLAGAKPPDPGVLPDDLRMLSRRNCFELTDKRWAYDCDQLLAAIQGQTGLRRAQPRAAAKPEIQVLEGAEVEDATIGNIVGVRASGDLGNVQLDGNIAVGRNSKLKKLESKDIVGLEISGTGAPGRTGK